MSATLLAPLKAYTGTSVTFENIKFKSDVRLRHETIDEQNQDVRNRQRIRARVGLYGSATENFDFGFRIATGGTGISSTNQTLTDGFSNKEIGFDQMYIQWKLSKQIKATIGKMPLPFFKPAKSQLIWDSDITPEGFNLDFKKDIFFANAGIFPIEERSSSDNAALYSAQLGVKGLEVASGKISTGVSTFLYSGLKGNDVISDSTKNFGNTVTDVDATATTQNQYNFEYQLYEFFFEYKGRLGKIPFVVAFDFVHNLDPTEDDKGYLINTYFGSTKNKSLPLVLGYNFREVEADATLGIFSDSDALDGSTNGRGHAVYAKYGIAPKTTLAIGLFLTEVNINSNPENYFRGQFDIGFKF